ncbi:hypothetical protein FB451DRAFT_1469232, partial [Mycena latifolia]
YRPWVCRGPFRRINASFGAPVPSSSLVHASAPSLGFLGGSRPVTPMISCQRHPRASSVDRCLICTFSLIVMWPRFFEVAPASRRISARHGLHNVFTTSMPLYASFCAPLGMHLPTEEPAQEPAPAVDEATSASETVVGAEEHAGAVSPYPYSLQPVQASQDAPAEPLAEANAP